MNYKRLICFLSLFLLWTHLAQSQFSYNKRVLNAMIDFNRKMKSDRLVVSINDTVVADVTYRGKPNNLFAIYSITKLFSGIAVGILIDKKLIDHPEMPISHFFEEWKTDSLKSKITLRHILQHTSGLSTNKGSQDIYPQSNFVDFALSSNVISQPGYTYFYNNKAINIISGLVSKVTGITLEQFITENVFKPLGIKDYTWKNDNAGNTWGMDGLWLSAMDLLKVGQMLSNYGAWNGIRILSKEWCELMFQLPLVNIMNGIGGYGMCIRSLVYDEQITINAQAVDKLKEAGLRSELASKLFSLRENENYKFMELSTALKQKFTYPEIEEISAFASTYMLPLYKISNENFVIMHGGEYGLLVTAFPKKNIVIVRYLGEKWGRKKKDDGTDNKYLIDAEIISYMLQLRKN